MADDLPTDCVFCERLARRDAWIMVAESRFSVAALANHQRTPGSVIIIPKWHCVSISLLPEREALDLFLLMHRVTLAVERAFDPAAMYVWQGGRIPMPHIHSRVSPRHADRPYTFVANSELQPTSDAERQEYAARIAGALPRNEERRALHIP